MHTREEIKNRIKGLFTTEEIKIIADMLANGHVKDIGAALHIPDPEHEYWLDQYLRLKAPHEMPESESVVRREMLEFYRMGGDVDSKEAEKFWQERLDLEADGKPLPPFKEALLKANILDDNSALMDKVETVFSEKSEGSKPEQKEPSNESNLDKLTKPKLMKLAKARELDVKAAMKKGEVLELLKGLPPMADDEIEMVLNDE